MALFISVILILAPIFLYNFFSTPIYESTAIVGFEDYSKDSIVDVGTAAALSRANFVANQVHEMRTQTFAQQIYESLPEPERRLFRIPHPLPPRLDAKSYVIKQIGKNLSVRSLNETDLITITYASASPYLATTIANTAVKVLQASNLGVRRQEYAGLKNFLDEQIRLAGEKLQNAEEALRQYKTGENLTSIDDESKEVLQRITQAEDLFNRVKADLDAAQKKLSAISKKLKAQKRDLASSMVEISDPLVMKLKENLVELNIQYSSLQAQGFADNHPKLVELNRQMQEIRQKLAQTTMEVLKDEKLDGVLDPLSQLKKNLEESIALQVEVQSLSAQKANLQETLNDYKKRLKALPGQELELVRLSRDKEVNNKIYIQLLEEREQARIREAAEIGNIRIVEQAQTPIEPARPRKMLNLIIGLFAGAALGFIRIFAQEFMKNSPRTQEETEQVLNLPVLASVPRVRRRLPFSMNDHYRRRWLTTPETPDPMLCDALSYLWNSVVELAPPHGASVLTVISSCASEGKSTIAANLSILAAQSGKRTILIDGDVRRPILHEVFHVPSSPGLTNLVSEATQSFSELLDHKTPLYLSELEAKFSNDPQGQSRLQSERQAMHVSILKALQQTSSLETLRILTAGDQLNKPHMLWSSPMIEEIISLLRLAADLIVIDSPPVIGIPDPYFIVRHADQVLLCVEAAKTEKKALQRTLKSLENARNKFIGVVLNKVDPATTYGGYKYYQRHYKGLDAVKKLF